LDTEPDERAAPDLGAEQSEVTNVFGQCGYTDCLADLFKLGNDNWITAVTPGMQISQNLMSLLPSILGSEPPWRLREEEHGCE
jgi:hypothetical protein